MRPLDNRTRLQFVAVAGHCGALLSAVKKNLRSFCTLHISVSERHFGPVRQRTEVEVEKAGSVSQVVGYVEGTLLACRWEGHLVVRCLGTAALESVKQGLGADCCDLV